MQNLVLLTSDISRMLEAVHRHIVLMCLFHTMRQFQMLYPVRSKSYKVFTV